MKVALGAAALIALSFPAHLKAQHSTQEHATHMVGSKSAKVTQVYEHPLPGVPGKSLKGLIVE
jgi:hypothetical protein